MKTLFHTIIIMKMIIIIHLKRDIKYDTNIFTYLVIIVCISLLLKTFSQEWKYHSPLSFSKIQRYILQFAFLFVTTYIYICHNLYLSKFVFVFYKKENIFWFISQHSSLSFSHAKMQCAINSNPWHHSLTIPCRDTSEVLHIKLRLYCTDNKLN